MVNSSENICFFDDRRFDSNSFLVDGIQEFTHCVQWYSWSNINDREALSLDSNVEICGI